MQVFISRVTSPPMAKKFCTFFVFLNLKAGFVNKAKASGYSSVVEHLVANEKVACSSHVTRLFNLCNFVNLLFYHFKKRSH